MGQPYVPLYSNEVILKDIGKIDHYLCNHRATQQWRTLCTFDGMYCTDFPVLKWNIFRKLKFTRFCNLFETLLFKELASVLRIVNNICSQDFIIFHVVSGFMWFVYPYSVGCQQSALARQRKIYVMWVDIKPDNVNIYACVYLFVCLCVLFCQWRKSYEHECHKGKTYVRKWFSPTGISLLCLAIFFVMASQFNGNRIHRSSVYTLVKASNAESVFMLWFHHVYYFSRGL